MTLTYEQCLALKKAGMDQSVYLGAMVYKDGETGRVGWGECVEIDLYADNWIRIPTLSELLDFAEGEVAKKVAVEHAGGAFWALVLSILYDGPPYVATVEGWHGMVIESMIGRGPTREEAIYNLLVAMEVVK